MKKITANEFKKILTDSGMDFDCFGYEGILNIISMFQDYKAKEANEKGCNRIAVLEYKIGSKIYDELYKRGFYNH